MTVRTDTRDWECSNIRRMRIRIEISAPRHAASVLYSYYRFLSTSDTRATGLRKTQEAA
jgi:hypothetical protein